MANEKIKILGAILELPAEQHCQTYLKTGPNWPNWQCCLAGSSKTAPRILIFPIAMDADYSFCVKSIATYVPAFLRSNNSVLARVANKALALRVSHLGDFLHLP